MTDTESVVRLVAIVGAGTMGRRIAYGCVALGVGVKLHDISEEALDEAETAVWKHLEGGVRGYGLTSEEALSLVETCPDLERCVRYADWVIEAVPENLELKREVLADIGAAAPPRAFVASNTSSLPGSWLAESTGRPDRFINMNFGTHEDLKVEVMGHPGTAPATTRAAKRFLRQLGLVPIVARRDRCRARYRERLLPGVRRPVRQAAGVPGADGGARRTRREVGEGFLPVPVTRLCARGMAHGLRGRAVARAERR